MRKRIFAPIVVLAIVFAMSGLALADNVIDIDQTGSVANPGPGPAIGKINYADITQVGSENKIEIGQVADTYNEAWASQVGSLNEIVIQQDAGIYNYAYVKQDGDENKLVGAFSDGTLAGTVIEYSLPATQDSWSSYNELKVIQEGDNNEVGLYQQATTGGYNSVDILQYNGGNSLVIHQTNIASGGYNEVTAEQSGDMTATVWQKNYSGAWLSITVTQTQGP